MGGREMLCQIVLPFHYYGHTHANHKLVMSSSEQRTMTEGGIALGLIRQMINSSTMYALPLDRRFLYTPHKSQESGQDLVSYIRVQ